MLLQNGDIISSFNRQTHYQDPRCSGHEKHILLFLVLRLVLPLQLLAMLFVCCITCKMQKPNNQSSMPIDSRFNVCSNYRRNAASRTSRCSGDEPDQTTTALQAGAPTL